MTLHPYFTNDNIRQMVSVANSSAAASASSSVPVPPVPDTDSISPSVDGVEQDKKKRRLTLPPRFVDTSLGSLYEQLVAEDKADKPMEAPTPKAAGGTMSDSDGCVISTLVKLAGGVFAEYAQSKARYHEAGFVYMRACLNLCMYVCVCVCLCECVCVCVSECVILNADIAAGLFLSFIV
jgi:hypothetical protein